MADAAGSNPAGEIYIGSNPIISISAAMVEVVYTLVLEASAKACGFESH